MQKLILWTCLALALVPAYAHTNPAVVRLLLIWQQPNSPTPIHSYRVYKRLAGAQQVDTWILVRFLSPGRRAWGDANVLPGQPTCYMVRSVNANGVEALNNPEACGVWTP